jgi:hypothetical protein
MWEGAVSNSSIGHLQFRLSVSTPPQSHAQNLQRGIHYYPAARQQQ